MIRHIGDWAKRMVRKLHLTPTDQILDIQKQRQEAMDNMRTRARAEFREQRLRAELEKLRLIQEARRGS